MPCSECGSPTISFSIPEEYREYAPDDAPSAAFCTRCLTIDSDPGPDSNSDGDADPGNEDAGPTTGDPDFSRVSDAFPTRPDRAIPLALALGLASSLATNRSAIESLLRDVERAGTDPLLVIDRLCADSTVEPAIDLDRRQQQLEQLLY